MDTQDKVVAMTPATITISKEDFDEAVSSATSKVIDKMEKDGEHSGMAMLLVPMTGMMFAHEVKDILFGAEEENNGEE